MRRSEEALQLDPSSVTALISKAQILIGRRAFDEAADVLDEALRVKPTTPTPWRGRAGSPRQGKHKEAADSYGRGRRARSDDGLGLRRAR